MSIDNCKYTFKELDCQVFPRYMAELRKRMAARCVNSSTDRKVHCTQVWWPVLALLFIGSGLAIRMPLEISLDDSSASLDWKQANRYWVITFVRFQLT